jgi:hypothetical protein
MKTIAKFFSALMITALFSSPVFAQSATVKNLSDPQKEATTAYTPGKFIDKNNNGTCDNFEAYGKNGRGARFVDANGDGVCDNRGTFGKGQGKGRGQGFGNGCRNGKGAGRGNGCGRGQGYGRGQGQGQGQPAVQQPATK